MSRAIKRQKSSKLLTSKTRRKMIQPEISSSSAEMTDSINSLALDDDDVPLKIRLERRNNNMQQVLQNPLLIHIIMNHSEFPELKICRLVNQTFGIASTEQIFKRDCNRTTLFSRYVIPDRLYDKNVDQDAYDLRCFNKVLKKSQKYPCSDYTLHILGGQANVRQFFEMIGPNIKTLSIFNSDHKATLDQELLRQILVDLAPNVDNLSLHGCQYEWNDKNKKLILPSLKRFSYAASSGTSQEIISNAPNLTTIDGFWFPSHMDVLDTGKTWAVQDLDCVVGDPADIHRFVAAGACKLRKLHMTNHWLEQDMPLSLKTACMTLLQSSVDTLTNLDLAGLFTASIILPKLPIMTKVKTLKLGAVKAREALSCLPLGVSLHDIFPNLRTLNLTRLLGHESANWYKHFYTDSTFCTVNNIPFTVYHGNNSQTAQLKSLKTLVVRDDLSEGWMNRLQNRCPNFTRVVVKSEMGRNIHIFLEKVFRLWTHLESIQIVIVGLSKPINLDSVFIGMTPQSCNRLRMTETREEGIEKFRVGPSICDIKGLKTLQIVFFIADSKSAYKFMKLSPLTHVSALYAFNLMSDLKVTLSYEYKTPMLAGKYMYKPPPNFQSISPHVNLRRKLPFTDAILMADSKGIIHVRD